MAVGSGLWTPDRRSGPGVCVERESVSDGPPCPVTSLDSGDRGETGKGTKDLQKLVSAGQRSSSHSRIIPTLHELAAFISDC